MQVLALRLQSAYPPPVRPAQQVEGEAPHMKQIRIVLWLALIAAFAAFIAMNAETARVNFWPYGAGYLHFDWPVGFVALVFSWPGSCRPGRRDACAAGAQAPHRHTGVEPGNAGRHLSPHRRRQRCGPAGYPPVSNPIYLAVDLPRLDAAVALGQKVKGHVGGLKLGLEFFCAHGHHGVHEMAKIGLPIFMDLKLHDIPNTVAAAMQSIHVLQPAIVTIHAAGGGR
jgi:hypothetical protein